MPLVGGANAHRLAGRLGNCVASEGVVTNSFEWCRINASRHYASRGVPEEFRPVGPSTPAAQSTWSLMGTAFVARAVDLGHRLLDAVAAVESGEEVVRGESFGRRIKRTAEPDSRA
jgi:hypothetical protein